MNKIAKFGFNNIKNINNEIEFSFIEKKAENTKATDLEEFNIKGIYGPNGTGKTALIEALTIYKMLVTNEDSMVKYFHYINELINNDNNSFMLSINSYLNNENIAKKTYNLHHQIEVALNNQKLSISSEKVYIDEKLIIDINNGEINELNLSTAIENKMINTLKHASVLARFKEVLFLAVSNDEKVELISDDIREIANIKNFMLLIEHCNLMDKMNIFFEEKDDHKDYFITRELDIISEARKDNSQSFEETKFAQIVGAFNKQKSHPQFTKKSLVSNDDIDNIRDELVSLTNFIKIFKPNLETLTIDTRPLRDNMLEMEVIAVYGNLRVSLEFESVGIKKLVELYFMIKQLNNGEIVVFDEIDAHLHDVALSEILCYLEDNATGQLIFTSHNLLTMDVLQEVKNSIDIISLSGEVTTWKRKGNAVARNLYKNGYISNDFDYGLFDLLGVFNV